MEVGAMEWLLVCLPLLGIWQSVLCCGFCNGFRCLESKEVGAMKWRLIWQLVLDAPSRWIHDAIHPSGLI